MIVVSPRPVVELATFVLIVAVIVLSFLSLAFILHFRRKSLASPSLHRFSPLWTVRLLLVSAAILWSVSQLLPLLGSNPFLCQLHVTLSLGLLEPSILLTVLFLLNSSIRPPLHSSRVVTAVLFSCLPMLILQTIFVYFSPFDDRLPELFTRSSYTYASNQDGTFQSTACMYPLLSTIVFGSFGAIFWMCFALSCYNVVTVVINKGLQMRTYGIALGVLIPLPVEVVFLGLSVVGAPGSGAHRMAEFGVVVCTLVSVVAAEGILVIRPILDALDVGTAGWTEGEDDHGGGSTVKTGATEEGSDVILHPDD
ncbi:hypothetical protein MLD38_019883 [Melastoma candidum]|uniref:Uncharacterized protein n=1 Tax=Melastoma candidum TaxID=119954 RepID=A0ACB9QBR0_9MYRT|nr:hypothetical protein MLD38_019883 [Melastoma candidum]